MYAERKLLQSIPCLKSEGEPSTEGEQSSICQVEKNTVLVLQTEKADTWTFTLIEALNSEVLKTVYGSSNVTTGTGTISVNATSAMLPDKAYVIDMALKGGAMKRIVIPQGSISELGEIVYKDDEAIGYEITITALPNSSGVTHYEYIKLATT